MSTVKTNTIQPVTTGDNLIIRTGSGDPERIRITTNGDVGIGGNPSMYGQLYMTSSALAPLADLYVENTNSALSGGITLATFVANNAPGDPSDGAWGTRRPRLNIIGTSAGIILGESYNSAANNLMFSIGNQEMMRLNPTGLGVNTNPVTVLHVAGPEETHTQGNAAQLLVSNVANTHQIQIAVSGGGTGGYIEGWRPGIGGMPLHFQPSGSASVFSGPLYVTTELHLPRVGVDEDGSACVYFANETTSSGVPIADGAIIKYAVNFGQQVGSADGLIIEKTDGNQPSPDGGIAFTRRGNTGVRTYDLMIRDGRVGIGVTGPTYTLDVFGTGRFSNNTNSNKLLVGGFGDLLGFGIRTDPANMTSCRPMVFFNTSNTMIGSISHPTTTTTAYNTSSDYRLKENVVPLTGGLSRINALKPSLFTWKNEGSLGEGFIAHELCDVVPLAVSGEKDQVDQNGDMVPQQVDMSKIVPILVAAIQELKGIVDAQAAEIAQLKAK